MRCPLIACVVAVVTVAVLVDATLRLPQKPAGLGNAPPRVAAVQSLLDRAALGGTVRVIVTLDVAVVPEGRLAPEERVQQRTRIAQAQTRLLTDLDAEGAATRFSLTAGVAMDVDAPTIRLLADHPLVRSIAEDRLFTPAVAESTAVIGAPAAWAAGYTGAGQTVAILDTGVDRNHPFLGGRVVYEACFGTTSSPHTFFPFCYLRGWEGPGSAAPCSMTGCEHGTQVAGTAAGSGASFQGVAPAANIIAMQIYLRYRISSTEQYIVALESDVVLALERVYDLRLTYNVAAVNLSQGWQSPYGDVCDDAAFSPTSLKSAVDHLASVGIATVVGSGNGSSGTALAYPACLSSAISVGSIRDGGEGATPADSVSAFSNSAPSLKLLAPGAWITSSFPGGGYGADVGTSFAAAHVTGAWALLKQRQPGASVSRILGALTSTGVPVTDPRNGVTTPRIDVGAAIQALSSCTLTLDPPSVSIGSDGGSGVIGVDTGADCEWSVTTASAMVSFAPASGTGPASIVYTVSANPVDEERTMTAVIADRTITIVQAPACLYTTSTGVSAGSGTTAGWLDVTAPAGCAWDATSNAPWLTFTNATGRSGSGTLPYTFAANFATGERTVTATIAGQAVPFTQYGAPFDPRARELARADFDGDGRSDLLWQDVVNGYLAVWTLDGHTVRSTLAVSHFVENTDWRIVGTGDFNDDGKPDIVWHHRIGGWLYLWYMDGVSRIGETFFSEAQVIDTDWQVVAVGDLTRDNRPDLLWRHATQGWVTVWAMTGPTVRAVYELTPNRVADPAWEIGGMGDFNGDGINDLIWRHRDSGYVLAWLMGGFNGLQQVRDMWIRPYLVEDTDWKIAAVIDANADNYPDLVWHHATTGLIIFWYMDGVNQTSDPSLAETVPINWKIVGPR